MSDQRVTSLDTDGGLGETSRDRRPLQPLLAKGSASVKKLSSNPPPSQGIFATPENESFYKLYSYSDLESTEQDIRLIHVFKDEHCDLIQCEFLPQSSLREASGSYHTLSYCAGDPLKAEPVLLQGIKFNAFANLQHALEQTLSLWKHKYPQEECVLWVDQICINQRNDAERSHQVGLMRDIYTNCRGTFISLSTADSYETGSNGMDWLRELAEAYQLPGTFQARRDKFWCILQENISNYNFFEGWYSFYELFQCPWWRRAWIHQEFICSPSATFMYHGSTIFSTHTSFLLLLCRTLSAFGIIGFLVLEAERSKKTRVPKIDRDLVLEICARNERARDSLEAVQLLLDSKETWRGDEDLKKVLAGSRHCRSSDPRDRIFAFLGLAHPGYGIETDYRKSNTLRATIIHTAKKILEFDQHLEMLAFAVRTIIVRPGVLPSWVPDWASTMILEDGHFARLPGQDKQFQHDAIGSSVIHPSTDANNVFLRV
ncbi:HET domain-containing protein [Fusarium falciforme]|uniref:HET domain-containing protein n=1 Tax=Fusarium falciforme TaxID=195108 RepID=UPI0023017DBA|nr:HET domain-containing protein [Fusarium falciforme]WAO96605.1 HET domain-containing protein [Fusarium falciforme]